MIISSDSKQQHTHDTMRDMWWEYHASRVCVCILVCATALYTYSTVCTRHIHSPPNSPIEQKKKKHLNERVFCVVWLLVFGVSPIQSLCLTFTYTSHAVEVFAGFYYDLTWFGMYWTLWMPILCELLRVVQSENRRSMLLLLLLNQRTMDNLISFGLILVIANIFCFCCCSYYYYYDISGRAWHCCVCCIRIYRPFQLMAQTFGQVSLIGSHSPMNAILNNNI